jgi:phosphatidylglycerol:prolipoprotein diacylglycerol transferase
MGFGTMTPGILLTALGYLIGALVLVWAARRKGLATEGMAVVALAALVGGVLGARLAEWLLAHRETVLTSPTALLDPRLGGRTLIGGVLGGWLAVEAAKRRLGIRRSTGDMFALALPAGEAVGRIGCYLNGCCYGVPTGVPWAVWQHEAWRHPAQLYAAGAAGVIFVALLLWRDRLAREGDLFRLYLVLFGTSRFVLEFWREREVALAGLSLAQWACLGVILYGCHRLRDRRARAAIPLAPKRSSP